MSESVKSVLDRALQLSDEDRGEVATRLLASLDSRADADADRAWAEEIQRRLADRSGSVPWEEARRQIVEDGDDDAR